MNARTRCTKSGGTLAAGAGAGVVVDAGTIGAVGVVGLGGLGLGPHSARAVGSAMFVPGGQCDGTGVAAYGLGGGCAGV